MFFLRNYDFNPTTHPTMNNIYECIEIITDCHKAKGQYDEMKKLLLSSIQEGDTNAMNLLGLYYDDIEQNDELMRKYFMMAIEGGNVNAMHNLSSHSAADFEIAKPYYLMAIEQGDVEAMYYLACYYLDDTEYELMEKYYLMAIEKGDIKSMMELAEFYDNFENYEEMIKYYLMAIGHGNIDAMVYLGNHYKRIETEPELMKKYYLMAIDQGDTYAMYNLACYYKDNNEYEMMKKYYLLAIDKGHIASMCDLGEYYKSLGNEYELMKKYYLMAIDLGDIWSMITLGSHYARGKSFGLAKKYLLMALPSSYALRELYTMMQGMRNSIEFFRDEIKNKSITLDQLCLIQPKSNILIEQLGGIHAKYECPYAMQLVNELTQKIFGNLCIADCPICFETTECGHYPCDERHKVCRDCYWKSPNKCYYNCSK